MININKYIAKYDNDIASKLKFNGTGISQEMRDKFKTSALYEILDLCSFEMTKYTVQYQSIWTYDGRPVVDLDDITDDVKVCIVSTLAMPER